MELFYQQKRKKFLRLQVSAVGDECTSSLKENDRVIYKEYSGTKVTVADQDYIVIDEKDIIAKFE